MFRPPVSEVELIISNATPLSILKRIVNPETARRNIQGCNGLHACALSSNDQRERFKLFLNNGADINSQINDPKNEFWNTPLLSAISNELSENVATLIEEASLANKPINYDIQDRQGKSALILAAKMTKKDIVLRLLAEWDKGVKMNIHLMDNDGNTALHYACALGQLDIVKELIRRGADSNARNKANQTPLEMATLSQEAIQAILNSVDVDTARDENAKGNTFSDGFSKIIYVTDPKGLTPRLYKIPARKENIAELQSVIKLNILDKSKMLQFAIAYLTNEQKQAMMKQVESYTGRSLLIACMEGQAEVRKFLENYLVVSKAFFEAFPNVEQMAVILKDCPFAIKHVISETQQTTLHLAVRAGDSTACSFLLKSGVEVNHRDKANNTALHLACDGANAAVIQQLLEAGANTKLKSTNSDTAVQLLLRRDKDFFNRPGHDKIRELFGFSMLPPAKQTDHLMKP